MIGLANRTQAYSDAFETALVYTVAGQADWADPCSPFTYGACAHWRASKAKGKGKCAEHARLMRGRESAVLRASQQACRRFATP
jgi:hypothetical protein